MKRDKQLLNYKVAIVVIFAVLLIFTPSLMAATGTVNVNTRYQTIEGFGAAGAWYEGWLTDHPNSETLYDLLFDQLGLDIYRVRNTYDYDSGYMSRTQTIVTEALQRNPNLKILISSWSPPTYLKSTGKLDEGTLIGGPSDYDYDGFAQWWADSITAWAGYGVDADYISIQNEPDWNGNDRCLFDPTQNSSHAGYDQAFEAVYNELHSRFGSSMPKMIGPETVSFTGAGGYISALITQSHAYGYAHHLYGPSNADDPDGYITGMSNFAATYGYKPLFQTEFSKLESPGAIYFTDAMNLAILMHNALTVEGVVSYFYWDLYWAAPGCLISFPSYGSSSYTINPVYYAFKHYAKFTDPGWQRVYATEDSANLRMSAYISPSNQQVTVVIINTGGSDVSLDLSFNGLSITTGTVYRSTSSQNCANVGSYDGSGTLNIPANSITTLFLYASTAPQQTLRISSTSGGSVTTPGEGDFQYNEGNYADIVATADQYYHFDVWTGSAVDAGKVADPCAASTTVLMDANYIVVANFEADPPSTDVQIIGSWVTGTTHAKESGYKRALVLIAHAEHTSGIVTLNSVTYGGQPMTKIIDEAIGTGYSANVTAFMLNEDGIDAATSGTFSPSWSVTPGAAAYTSVFLRNVDQTTSVGDINSAGTTSSNPIVTDPLPTEEGDMVFVAATCGNLNSYMLNNGFAEGTDQQFGDATTGGTGVAGYKPATGIAEIPSATYNASINRQVIIGFVVQAQGAPTYLNCGEVQAAGLRLESDLNGNCYVDYEDLETIAYYWLDTECGDYNNCEGADFEPTDGTVDLYDFSDFAVLWMQCNNPEDPDCVPNW